MEKTPVSQGKISINDGKRLREVRDYLKLTPQVLAGQLGLKYQKLLDIERGRVKIPIAVALYLEEKYGIDFKWIITGIGNITGDSSGEVEFFPEILDLQEWLTELCHEEPSRREWFKFQLIDTFPLFNKWLKKRSRENVEDSNRRAA